MRQRKLSNGDKFDFTGHRDIIGPGMSAPYASGCEVDENSKVVFLVNDMEVASTQMLSCVTVPSKTTMRYVKSDICSGLGIAGGEICKQ